MTTRRDLVLGSAALAAAAAARRAAGASAPATAGAAPANAAPPRPAFRAAVLRTPVEIPITAAALEATRRRNTELMLAAIDAVMKGPAPQPRLLVFPVLQLTSARRAVSGVPMSAVAVDLVSGSLDATPFASIVAACRRHGCYVVTSTQEKIPQMPGVHFHTGIVLGPNGLVLRSPKAQAQSAPEVSYLRDIAEDYRRIFGRDSIMPVAETPIGRIGCFVEGEAEVLEASRLLSSKGAELILHTSMEDTEVPWLALKQAIGFQCHVFLLTGATSRFLRADRAEPEWAAGAATIVGPDGRVLASKGEKDEGAAIADIDLGAIAVAKQKFGRNTVPAWGLYSELYRAR